MIYPNNKPLVLRHHVKIGDVFRENIGWNVGDQRWAYDGPWMVESIFPRVALRITDGFAVNPAGVCIMFGFYE